MRAQTVEILYERTLAHVIRGKSLLAAEPYLSRIGQRLEELRAAYRAPNVELDYGDPELVDAYLLGYYPHYVHTAAEAFEAIPCDTLRASSAFGLRVLFIGGGPLPELVALVDRLRTCGITHARVYATVIDLHAPAWAHAVAHTEAVCSELAPSIHVQIVALQADVSDALSADTADGLAGVHLIVIQNCLNEVARTLDVAGHNSLLRGVLAPGGFIGISDLTEYPVICEAVARYEALFERGGLVPIRRFDPGAQAQLSAFHRPPPRVFYGFFGAIRNGDSYTVPRQPKKWLRSSVSVWRSPPG
jgi:hypothetical protein